MYLRGLDGVELGMKLGLISFSNDWERVSNKSVEFPQTLCRRKVLGRDGAEGYR